MLDITVFIEALGHKRIHLVAHDWGGCIAYALAFRHAALLKTLTIINAPHPLIFARELEGNPIQQKANQYIQTARNGGLDPSKPALACEWLTQAALSDSLSQGLMNDEVNDRYIEMWQKPGVITGMINYYKAIKNTHGNYDPDAPTYKIQVPTQIIWGENDHALVIQNLDGLENYLNDFKITRIPDATHWVVRERPDEVTRLIQEMITREQH